MANGFHLFQHYILRKGILAGRLGSYDAALVFTVNYEDVALAEEKAGKAISMLLPMLLTVFLFAGAMQVGMDIIAGEKERTIILPGGKWFDFYTGEYVASGPGEIVVPASLENIPLLVRDGGIIPLMPPLQHVPDSGETVDLELRHYGIANGTSELYDDDGETYNYEQGEFLWYGLSVKRDVKGVLWGDVSRDMSDSYTYAKATWRFMTEKAQPSAPADAGKPRR